MYYGGHLYNGYGYAMPPQDPSMYAAPYGGYSFYGNQQQVSWNGITVTGLVVASDDKIVDGLGN